VEIASLSLILALLLLARFFLFHILSIQFSLLILFRTFNRSLSSLGSGANCSRSLYPLFPHRNSNVFLFFSLLVLLASPPFLNVALSFVFILVVKFPSAAAVKNIIAMRFSHSD
jgi:hypothetical protein